MTNSAHKECELEDANDFVQLWPEWASDRPAVCGSESPDIQLRFRDGRIVGLEHTRLMHEKMSAGDAAALRLYREIRSAVRKQRVFGARVIPTFDNSSIASLKPRERRRTVAAIVDLARKVVRERGNDVASARAGTRFAGDELRALGIRGFLEVKIDSIVNGPALLAQGLPQTSATFVDECITAKDRKLPDYRRRHPSVAEFWLLLVSGYGVNDPDWRKVRRAKAQSGFRRTFFLRYISSRISVYELGTDTEVSVRR